jgi:hypothetical protein
MRCIACAPVLAVLLLASCRDDEPRRPANPAAPDVAVVAEEAPLDTSSSVCRAYVREYTALRAAKDSGVVDVRARQRSAALSAVIADACR